VHFRLSHARRVSFAHSRQAGNTPLHNAAYEGWLEGVTLLLQAGAKVNASNNVRARAHARARCAHHAQR
jgi:ankyrin repeat protein